MMKIAFDAKRAFKNQTGLGQYSRTLITALCTNYPENKYFLCTPETSPAFTVSNCMSATVLRPKGVFANLFKSAWRSSGVKHDLKKKGVDIYHGLSHEIPLGIQHTGIRSVVTIHDLIFEKHPEQYNAADVLIYRKKFKNACENADKIIAISEQTKKDLREIYHIPEEKISVCYQSCDPAFSSQISAEEKSRIKNLYQLPDRFYLSVGSIIERKNLLLIAKAMKILKDKSLAASVLPLVVIGEGKKYKQQVKDFLKDNDLQDKMIFLNENEQIKSLPSFNSSADLPAIFQLATAMIYPSTDEGFGIPVLEALWSRLPVITSDCSALPEAGGSGACYIDPYDADELATAMSEVADDEVLRQEMIRQGCKHVANFTPEKTAAAVMNVYQSINN